MSDSDMGYGDFVKIKVASVGGGGSNAVNRMINNGVEGVGFIAFNTGHQALKNLFVEAKTQISGKTTKGFGVGTSPSVGEQSIEESLDEIRETLEGTDMVLITAGMGGGTGTDAAPVIAEVAKEVGALTVGVVTRPFTFEGAKRKRQAKTGIKVLKDKADTPVITPNDRLLRTSDKRASFVEAFEVADEVLKQEIQGISDLISIPNMINFDFVGVKVAMYDKGIAHMGTGFASGDERAKGAAKTAIQSPLLETSIEGTRSVLLNITGGGDLGIFEVTETADLARDAADEDANIILSAEIDKSLKDQIKVTIIATDFDIYSEDKASSTNLLDTARNKMKEDLKNKEDKKNIGEL